MRNFLALMCVVALAACASTPQPRPDPEIKTVEVKVATPVPCKALASLGPEPDYPDTDAAIKTAPSIGALAKIYAKGRLMRMQRLSEYSVAKASCLF